MIADPGRPEPDGGSASGSGLGPHVRLIAGREVLFDGEEFLHDFDDWSEEVCEALAAEGGLTELTDRHWTVIRFMRDFYATNGRGPLNRKLIQGTGMSLLELEGSFPGGIKYGARRLAGLPNPKGC